MTAINRLVLIGGLACLAGCATAPHRARQYSAEYDALPEETRERVANGFIREGDTSETVYIAMGPPQSRQKIRDDFGLYYEHWIYLGRPAPGQDEIEPGNYRFVTVNDMSWSNPFDSDEKNQRIHVVFLDNVVQRVEVEDEDGTPLVRPKMSMPGR